MEVLQNSSVWGFFLIFRQLLGYFLLYTHQQKSVWLSTYCTKIHIILNDPLKVMGIDMSLKLCKRV